MFISATHVHFILCKSVRRKCTSLSGKCACIEKFSDNNCREKLNVHMDKLDNSCAYVYLSKMARLAIVTH